MDLDEQAAKMQKLAGLPQFKMRLREISGHFPSMPLPRIVAVPDSAQKRVLVYLDIVVAATPASSKACRHPTTGEHLQYCTAVFAITQEKWRTLDTESMKLRAFRDGFTAALERFKPTGLFEVNDTSDIPIDMGDGCRS